MTTRGPARCEPRAATVPLPYRLRPDLAAVRQIHDGVPVWLVKDPLTLQYFRFGDHEFAVLKLLDGKRTAAELLATAPRHALADALTPEDLARLLSQAEGHGLLLIAEAPPAGQADRVARREAARRQAERWSGLLNPLAVRFSGIDPDRFLTWVTPRLGFLFSPWCVAACLLLMVAAALLVLVELPRVAERLPEFRAFFTPSNMLWLALTLGAMKALHELGHAITAKRFGAACHELGVMFLVLSPCLYCNVSDAWLIRSKWKRAAIALAGMYVELTLASVATFLWWFSQPGLFQHLCLNVMVIGGVNSLVFNGNPLLRYDAYYVLSDLLEIPNLRQKSRESLYALLWGWCSGATGEERGSDSLVTRVSFAAYAVASTAYGWLVTFSVLWFLNRVFEPYGLKLAGQMLACLILAGMFLIPVLRALKFLVQPERMEVVNPLRFACSLAVLAALVALACLAPLPHRVFAPLVLEVRDAQPVYVELPGVLDEVRAQAGEHVEAGAVLARLSSVDRELTMAQLERRRHEQQVQLEDLRRRRFVDQEAAALIPAAVEGLTEIERRIVRCEADCERLTLTAPCSGVLLAPARTPAEIHAVRDRFRRGLPRRTGTPLDAQNLGAPLEPGLFCLVGDPERLEAILVIDQADIEFVRAGQTVELVCDQTPDRRFVGQVAEVSQLDVAVAPPQLTRRAGGKLATLHDPTGAERPLSTVYQAKVHLEDPSGLARAGLCGQARIAVGRQTLVEWAARAVCQTFHFRL